MQAIETPLKVQSRGAPPPAAVLGQDCLARLAGDAVVAGGGAAAERNAVAEAGMGLGMVEDRAAAGSVQADGRRVGVRLGTGPRELDADVAQHAAGVIRVRAPVD